MTLYVARDRLSPWYALMAPTAVERLKACRELESPEELGALHGAEVDVRLFPRAAPEGFQGMKLAAVAHGPGVVKLVAHNASKTVGLVFVMDVARGRLHAMVEDGGMSAWEAPEVTEADVANYTRFVHSVIGNATAEVLVPGVEPVNCEVIIPVNIIPRAPEEAVAEAVEAFRRFRAQPAAQGSIAPPSSLG